MKIIRSSKLYFNHLTESKKQEISVILKEYSKAANYFIKTYKYDTTSKKFDLLASSHIQKYIALSKTWLSYRLISNAFSEAYGMLQSYHSNKKLDPRHKLPRHTGLKAILSENNNKQSEQVNTKLFDFNVELYCLGNKKRISIPLHKHRQFNKWAARGQRSKSIVLTKNHIQFSFEIKIAAKPVITIDTKNIGLDTGLNSLASTSTNNFYGKELKSLIENINRKQQGSQNQKQAIIQLKQYIDLIAKQIILTEKPDLLVVEKLDNITKNIKRRLPKKLRKLIKSWNYRYFLNRVQQQCEENRVVFRSVPAYNTSITCSQCGHIDKKQRCLENFDCGLCGHSDHADHNAAINILNRCLQGAYSPLLNKSNK